MAAKLAVFIGAGLVPSRAWQELVDDGDESVEADVVRDVVDRLTAGSQLVEAITDATDDEDESWRVLAAVHSVAHDTGAPLGDALWALSTALQERYDAERAVRATILAPIYTQRLLMALPLFGLLVSGLMGVNAVAFLTSSPLGWMSLAVATLLMAAAWRWSRAMVSDAIPGQGFLSPALDLFAISTSGGAPPELARVRVDNALVRHRLESLDALNTLPALSRRVGVPVRALAVAEASWLRARVKADAAEKAAALSVKILIPLGILVLPAFVIVAVIPVIFALLNGAFAAGGLW